MKTIGWTEVLYSECVMMGDWDSYNACFAVILGFFPYFPVIAEVPFFYSSICYFFSRLYFNTELNTVEAERAVPFCIVCMWIWRLWT